MVTELEFVIHKNFSITFQSLVGPTHGKLHYSPSHLGPPQREKCWSVKFWISHSSVTAIFFAL